MVKFSATTCGFYDESIHITMPEDVCDVSDADYRALMLGQASGLEIVADTLGRPILAERTKPAITTLDVDRERDRRIDAGFVFDGVLFQSDAGSRENIAGAKSAASDAIMLGAQAGDFGWQRLLDPNATDTFVWIATDNSLHPMDAQTMVRFGYAAMAHKQDMIFKARNLKAMDLIPADYATNDAYWA